MRLRELPEPDGSDGLHDADQGTTWILTLPPARLPLRGDLQPAVRSNSSAACMDADLGHYVDSNASASCGSLLRGDVAEPDGPDPAWTRPGALLDNASASQTPCSTGTYNPQSGSNSSGRMDADPGHYVDSNASTSQTPCSGDLQPAAPAARTRLRRAWTRTRGTSSIERICQPGSLLRGDVAEPDGPDGCMNAVRGTSWTRTGRSPRHHAPRGPTTRSPDPTRLRRAWTRTRGTTSIRTHLPARLPAPRGRATSRSVLGLEADPGHYVLNNASTSQTPADLALRDSNASASQAPCSAGTWQNQTARRPAWTRTRGTTWTNASTSQIACSPGSYNPFSGICWNQNRIQRLNAWRQEECLGSYQPFEPNFDRC